MSVLNHSTVVGRLSRDVNVSSSGDSTIAKGTVAVTRDFKNKDGNYEADFISFVAFGKTAEFIEKFFKKGDVIAIEGAIRTGSYQNKDGATIYTTDIAVEKASFVPGSKKSDEVTETTETKKSTTKKAKKEEVDPDEDFMSVSADEELPW